MLSREQRRALYSRAEMPKDRKRTRAPASSDHDNNCTIESSLLAPKRKRQECPKPKKIMKALWPAETPPRFEKGGQATQDKLQDANLGADGEVRPTFISGNMSLNEKENYLELLK